MKRVIGREWLWLIGSIGGIIVIFWIVIMILVVHSSRVALSEDRDDLKNWKEIAEKLIQPEKETLELCAKVRIKRGKELRELKAKKEGVKSKERARLDLYMAKKIENECKKAQENLENFLKAQNDISLRKKLYTRHEGKSFLQLMREALPDGFELFLRYFLQIILIGLAFIYGARLTYHSIKWVRKKK